MAVDAKKNLLEAERRTKRVVDQAIAFSRGEAVPGVRLHIAEPPPEIDVKKIRLGLEMTQAAFAQAFDLPLASLRKWEQQRRRPDASTRVLLGVIERTPEAVMAAVADQRERSPVPHGVAPSIRRVRRALGLTQVELAQLVHCHPSQVSRWENGAAVPDAWQLSVIERLAHAAKHADGEVLDEAQRHLADGAIGLAMGLLLAPDQRAGSARSSR